jgi:hypothetical protein
MLSREDEASVKKMQAKVARGFQTEPDLKILGQSFGLCFTDIGF